MKIKKVIARGTAKTSGRGCWSNAVREVHGTFKSDVFRYDIEEWDNVEPDYYGYINIYFAKKDWDIEKHGLIYTDPGFMKGAKAILKEAGIKHYAQLSYSEQGMQGKNFVNCDVGDRLAKELIDKGYAKAEEW